MMVVLVIGLVVIVVGGGLGAILTWWIHRPPPPPDPRLVAFLAEALRGKRQESGAIFAEVAAVIQPNRARFTEARHAVEDVLGEATVTVLCATNGSASAVWTFDSASVVLRGDAMLSVHLRAGDVRRTIVVTDDLPVVIGEVRTWAVANGVLGC